MPAAYLHGVEFIENNSGPVPIEVVRSAVIGLVGTAPTPVCARRNPAVEPEMERAGRAANPRRERQRADVRDAWHDGPDGADLGDRAQRADRGRRRSDLGADAAGRHAGAACADSDRQRESERAVRRADSGLHNSVRAADDSGAGRRPGDRCQRVRPDRARQHDQRGGDVFPRQRSAGDQPRAHGRVERQGDQRRRFDDVYPRHGLQRRSGQRHRHRSEWRRDHSRRSGEGDLQLRGPDADQQRLDDHRHGQRRRLHRNPSLLDLLGELRFLAEDSDRSRMASQNVRTSRRRSIRFRTRYARTRWSTRRLRLKWPRRSAIAA